MTNIDEKIRKALPADGDWIARELSEEPGIFRQLGDMLRGPNRWLTVPALVLTFAFTLIGIWALVRFLGAVDMRAVVGFATLFLVAYLSVMVLKVWFWMQMNKNTLTREILRLELRIEEIQRQLLKDG